jgi:uncharacterized membrane protein
VTPDSSGAEALVMHAVLWLRLAIETTGAALVAVGFATAAAQLVRRLATRLPRDFNGIRLTLARYLALALEFQLGADILSTAIAPSWEQIGKLAAIAVIRTALNWFLGREMADERLASTPPPAQPPGGPA